MKRTLAITFKDEPNVIHLESFVHQGAAVIDLKLQVLHPRLKIPVVILYRRTSTRGSNVYYYSEGTKAGEALGG
jgi:hypothetical protein